MSTHSAAILALMDLSFLDDPDDDPTPAPAPPVSAVKERKTGAECPECAWPLDRGRCWSCHWRLCAVCRTQKTGSAFMAVCLCCGLVECE
ncbi:hypothetical protein [Frigoriglobus tundricola]|uniref:Uncharacterized protein n=1 Tax=Frigoriglobus tundricola TaxID=2774151 RepID=A0A6M5YND4_9BACT|nr:hypothetical protein [Frigoriglobus tundricola]QJW95619.1 hypothetical protein FTUN_3170 [Frigoriglobus tundricola]